jgi:hypothetical protein
LISFSDLAIQLNATHRKLLLSAQSQITATETFTEQSVALLDIEINTLQITIVSSLKAKVDKLIEILLALQNSSESSSTQLTANETTTLVNVISSLTSLLQGYGQSFCKMFHHNFFYNCVVVLYILYLLSYLGGQLMVLCFPRWQPFQQLTSLLRAGELTNFNPGFLRRSQTGL